MSVRFPTRTKPRVGRRTDEIHTFPAAELWKYLDDDAERYLEAGVESISTGDYKFQDKSDALVDIYTMSAAAGAKNAKTNIRVGTRGGRINPTGW